MNASELQLKDHAECTEHEARIVGDLFQLYPDALGFVNRARVVEGTFWSLWRDHYPVAALLGNHNEQNKCSVIYEIAVYEDARGNGLGQRLVEALSEASPYQTLKAKCPYDNPSNQFYVKTGWKLEDVERADEDRPLCVWVKGSEPKASSASDW